MDTEGHVMNLGKAGGVKVAKELDAVCDAGKAMLGTVPERGPPRGVRNRGRL
jgi:succinyl-CoA synthetase beta subunit